MSLRGILQVCFIRANPDVDIGKKWLAPSMPETLYQLRRGGGWEGKTHQHMYLLLLCKGQLVLYVSSSPRSPRTVIFLLRYVLVENI